MGIPEFQRQHDDPRGISIARLISSEFGSSEDTIRRELNHSSAVIEIDGVRWDGDKHFIPRKMLRGRVLVVIGHERQWRMKYPQND